MNPHDDPFEKHTYKVRVCHMFYYDYEVIAESIEHAHYLGIEMYVEEKNPKLIDEDMDTTVWRKN